MNDRDPAVPLRHMLDAARRAIEIAEDRSRADLEQEDVLTLALIRLVEVVGEASRRVPEELRRKHARIPWREIAGTRDRLIHGYDAVDLDILWNIVSTRLPELVPHIERMLTEL